MTTAYVEIGTKSFECEGYFAQKVIRSGSLDEIVVRTINGLDGTCPNPSDGGYIH